MFRFDIPVEKIQDQYIDEASQFIEIDKLRVHYKDEGYGEAIILLHDSVSSLHIWDEWVKLLSPHFRVIRLDLPGFGITGTINQETFNIDTYIYFLKKFTTRLGLGLENFFIAGVSLGGHIAWQYTLLHPHKIKKLVLINSLGYPEQVGPFTFRMGKSWFGQFILQSWSSKTFIQQNLMKDFGDKKKVDKHLVQRVYDLMLRKGNRAAVTRLANASIKYRNQRIQDILTPTIVLHGTLNQARNYFLKALPNAQHILYKGIGRYSMIEIPNRSATDVIKFLQS